ncbi:MAG: aminotransferase class V-fold PLP-dependent enzyme [Pirellulales bacterium]|nr:aminotransferase class V-fold PLP-dependent enzyme [Pirellulales bacterium]
MSVSDSSSGSIWSEFRRQMPVTERWAYFDHAAVAPISLPARQAVTAWAEESVTVGDTRWPQWSRRLGEIRDTFAQLIHAGRDEIAFVANTTHGIGLVAEGLDWRPGDNVVTLADEFPSNAYPWLNLASRGVETRRVPTAGGRVDLAAIDNACDARTRVVSVSWIGYASGWRNDPTAVAEVAHKNGALFFLDAIQGLGVMPLDAGAAGVDFLAADGHKWLLGPEGAGVLYIRKANLDQLRPTGVGWNSVAHHHDYSRIELNFKPAAERFEGGSPNMPGLHALGASADLLAALSAEAISERIQEITDHAIDRLRSMDANILSVREADRWSGIVSFEVPGKDPASLRKHCLDQGVVMSCRAGRLRISPHAYNNDEDIERLVAALASGG